MKIKELFLSPLVILILVFCILEFMSFQMLNVLSPNDLFLNNDTLIEVESGYLRLRKNIFKNLNKIDSFLIGSKKELPGFLFFGDKEGFVTTNFGDFIVNKWGFRGPYFSKKKPKKVYRIMTLGGSTTLGWKVSDEQTYPRILERMLNNSSNRDMSFQVINAGMYYHNSCHVKHFLKKNYLEFKPDMIILMAGWNDGNKLRNGRIKSEGDYCPKPLFLNNFYSFKFLRYLRSKLRTSPPAKNLGSKVLNKNLKYFEKNFLEEIIEISKESGIQVGLVTLPTIMDKSSSIKSLKKLLETTKLNEKEIRYQREVGIKINQLYRAIAKRHLNVFKINSGISFNAEGKGRYFFDNIHPLASGNRVLSFSIYKELNQKLKIHPRQTEGYLDGEKINSSRLEVEYVKSILTQNEIEDIASSGCITFHRTCDSSQKFNKYDFLNNVFEFSLGSLLQFREVIKKTKFSSVFEKFLSEAIKLDPDYSLIYWILSLIKNDIGKNDEAVGLMQKALLLNPKLKEIDFEFEYKKFQNLRNDHPFLSFADFLYVIRSSPSNISTYIYGHSLYSKKNTKLEKPLSKSELQKLIDLLLSTYYSRPLLVYSMFDFTLDYLSKNKETETIQQLLPKIMPLKREYKFSQLFSKYSNDLPN